MELVWTFEYGELTAIGALPQGAMFETLAGVRAIVVYAGGHDPAHCISLDTGEYVSFVRGDDEPCYPITLSRHPMIVTGIVTA